MKRPTYTPASYIKKVFRLGERSLPKDEIIGRLNQEFAKSGQTTDGERMLQELLSMPQSPVRVGSSEAIIELTFQPHQLFDLAYRYVRDTHAPKTMEQILREVRRRTSFSWNQAARLLVLEKDPRFVQYAGDPRWFLAEWQLMNDEVYAWLTAKRLNHVSLRTLSFMAEQELGSSYKEYIFLPERDDRFKLEGDNLYLIEQEEEFALSEELALNEETAANEELPREEIADQSELAKREAAVTVTLTETQPTTTREETLMNMTQQANTSVQQEVNHHLRQALALLEERNQQMAQEVIGYFQQSDIQAIELLMKEKHKNEQAVLGIQQVLAQYEQQ